MKNNNKRGFTLIEVLGVIVILLLLVLITTPIVINYIKGASKDAENVQNYTIKEAAKSWLSSRDNISLTPTNNNECIEVTLRELKEQGYIDYDIKDPKTKELLSDDITVIIRKVNNDLTYEINETGEPVCTTTIDSTYPRWTYVSSNKTAITKNDTVVVKIKGGSDILSYSLTASDITVKAGSSVIENAIINNISCTGTNEVVCDVTISNIDKDGRLNLVIEKETLINTNDKKSRITPVLTDVVVDNKGPEITYISKTNTNESRIYATDDDEIEIIFEVKDENISTANLDVNGIEVYVGNSIKNATKNITRDSIEKGYRYILKLTNVTGDGELSIKIKANQISDTLGNSNKEKIITPGITIDNTLPDITIEPNGTEEYQTEATSKIIATDSNGIKEPIEYVWSTSINNTTYSQTVSNEGTVTIGDVTGDFYLIAHACDNAGNCTRKVSNKYQINNQKPEIVFIPNGNTTYEAKKDVVIKAISNGPALDLATLKYVVSQNINSNVTKEYTNNQTIKLENMSGVYYIIAEACDTLGNCTREVSNPYKLDGEKPIVRYISKTNTNKTNGQAVEYATKNDTITIVFEGTDNISYNDGLTTNDITVRVNGNVVNAAKVLDKTNIENGKRYTLTLENVTGEGILTISIDKTKVKDNAGNEAVVGVITPGIIMDNTAPTITYDKNGNNEYQKSQTSKISVSDNREVNTSENKYIWSTDTNATPNVSFTSGSSYTKDGVTGDYYIVATACDKAGNCNTKYASNVFKIDNTKPTITFDVNGNSTYQKSQTSKITVNDNHSGGDTATYKYIWTTDTNANPTTSFTSGSSYTKDGVTGDYYIVATACDKAGNCTTKQASNVFKIDNTKPTITLTPDGNNTWSTSQSSKITVSDDHSGGNTSTYKYIWSETNTATANISFTNNETVTKDEVTGEYYLIVRACDKAGNCEDKVSNVFKISNEPPEIVFGTNGNTTYAKSQSSKITVNQSVAPLDTSSFKYIWTTDPNNATPNVTFTNGGTVTRNSGTGNYYLKVTACDIVGNCRTVTSDVFKLDNTAPTITFGTNGNSTYQKSQTSKITVNDNHSGGDTSTYKYIWSTDTNANPTTSFTSGSSYTKDGVTGDYYIVATACDLAGNCTTKQASNVFKIDNTKPTITLTPDGNNTYAKSQTSKITVNDNHSGGDTSTYKYIWSETNTATANISFTNNETVTKDGVTGEYYLIVRACDKAGNCEDKVSTSAFKISNSGPEITFGTDGNNTYAKSQSTTINVSSVAPIDTSTLKYVWVESATSTTNPTETFTNGGTVTRNSGTGNYYLKVRACDTLGNCTTKTSNVFKLDNEAPVVTLTPDGNNTWSTSQSSKITVNDNHSGGDTSTYKYIWSTTTSATPNTSFTSGRNVTLTSVTGEYYLIVKACDIVGNCTTKVSTNVFKISNSGPEITFETDGNNTYQKSQSTKIIVTAGGSPVDTSTLKYVWVTSATSTTAPNISFTSGSTYTKSDGTGNYYLKVTACDIVGNCETKVSKVFKLDNTAPTITFGTNGNSSALNTQTSTINVVDYHAGGNEETYKYIWSTSESATPNTTFISGNNYSQSSGNGNYYLRAYACDVAGNCTTNTSNKFLLDNTAPSCNYSGENTTWTTNNVSVTVTCSDTNGCKTNKSTNTWSYTSGTHKIEAISYEIEDSAGNTTTCSKTASIYVDKDAPSTPSCSAPVVSGINTTGSIQAASESIDAGVGGVTYRYLINNTGTTPANTNSGFTTSRTFERACGRSYYGYVYAQDSLGNKTAVVYCGSGADAANSYSEWSECSEPCGGGTQTRTNACGLITTGLSQSCNEEACCTMPDVTEWEYNYTGGVQSFTVPEDGIYMLEVYGAQGGAFGNDKTYGGGAKGGYSSGYVTLHKNDVLYIAVGGAGMKGGCGWSTGKDDYDAAGGYNGGGAGKWYGTGDNPNYKVVASGGGGATHIGKTNNILKDTSVSNLYIVAGGGGGTGDSCAAGRNTTSAGGTGGGTSGGSSSSRNYGDNDTTITKEGASQTSGYAYGQGGNQGGGGGFYGGYGADGSASWNSDGGNGWITGGTGGSGYIGGVTDGTTSNGVREGNGYAKITLVSNGCDIMKPSLIANDGLKSGEKHINNFDLNVKNISLTSGLTNYYSVNSLATTSSSVVTNGKISITSASDGDTYYVMSCDNFGKCSEQSTYTVRFLYRYPASSRVIESCPADGAYCGSSCSDGCIDCYSCPDGSGVCGCEKPNGAHWIHVYHNRYNSDLGRVTTCCTSRTEWYCPDGGTLIEATHMCEK